MICSGPLNLGQGRRDAPPPRAQRACKTELAATGGGARVGCATVEFWGSD